MTQSLATVVVPFFAGEAWKVDGELARLGDPKGEPYQATIAKLNRDEPFVHFMSMVVIPAEREGDRAHLGSAPK